MDKKNTIIGVTLLVVGMIWLVKNQPQPRPQETAPDPSVPSETAEPGGQSESVPEPTTSTSSTPEAGQAKVETNGSKEGESITRLHNEYIDARFSNIGGAIKDIELFGIRRTIDGPDNYVMNELHYRHALNLTTYLGDGKDVVYELVESRPDSIVYRAALSPQLEVTRRYSISQDPRGAEPYLIRHELTFRNLGSEPLPLGDQLRINIGTVAPSGRQDRFLQTFGHYNGNKVKFKGQTKFTGGGFWIWKSEARDYIQESGNIVWASVKNQFFITVLTPEQPGAGYVARAVDFEAQDSSNDIPNKGLTADLKLPSIVIPANDSVTQNFTFYAGPKEHKRLSKLDQKQEKAMQFGFFGIISKLLLLIMNWLFSLVNNWGIAIILLTLVVRGTLLPITLMSMRSMRKMSKLQEPMKKLREKIPAETPEQKMKQQQMMMELYKINKINPVAGCLPMLAQIPIFFALFYMLRSAAELRFADFLWINDLSKPDTIAILPNLPILGDFPLNALPFLWLASLAYQMWTMPTPSVDNAQAKMMKFMPFIFFPITYMFSSGLVLYWTVSNVFTIGQQWLAKRNDPEFEVQLPPSLKKALDGDQHKKGKRRKK